MSLKKLSSRRLIISFAVSFSLLVILINPEPITARSQDSNNAPTTPEKVVFSTTCRR